jgi:hypothetical protein
MLKAITLGAVLWLAAAAAPASALPLQMPAAAAAVEDGRIGFATGVCRPELQLAATRYYRRGRSVSGHYRRGRYITRRR